MDIFWRCTINYAFYRNYLQEEQQRLLETRTVKERLRTDAKNGFRKFNRIFFNVALQGPEKIV